MKRFHIAPLGALVIAIASLTFAQSGSAASMSSATSTPTMHSYLIKRTFPAGALAGLDQATKGKINATNAKFHVKWIRSYETADKQTTFCIYEGPNEQAVRDAAKANKVPVDAVYEVPVTLMPRGKDVATQ